jgi:hypothetical protein
VQEKLGKLLANWAHGGDVVLMRVGDEQMLELQLLLFNQPEDWRRVPARIKQGRFARDLIPHDVTIHGVAALGGGDLPEFAPPAGIDRRRPPPVGDGFQFAGLKTEG